MQQFTVPQFIDVETKIIGPITVRQFIILIIAGLFIFLAYRLARFTTFLIEAAFIITITVLFAFVKVNGRAFHYFLLNFIQTTKRPKIRVWDKGATVFHKEFLKKEKPSSHVRTEVALKPPPPKSRLSELALLVDTGGAFKGGIKPNEIKEIS